MAKTQTKLTRAQVEAAYEKLQDAVDVFTAAITEFQTAYDPNTVGLNDWSENIEGVMMDVYDDIENSFEE